MSGTILVWTIVDVILAIVVIVGLINEEKLIEFEDEFVKMLKRYKKYRQWKKRMAKGGK